MSLRIGPTFSNGVNSFRDDFRLRPADANNIWATFRLYPAKGPVRIGRVGAIGGKVLVPNPIGAMYQHARVYFDGKMVLDNGVCKIGRGPCLMLPSWQGADPDAQGIGVIDGGNIRCHRETERRGDLLARDYHGV